MDGIIGKILIEAGKTPIPIHQPIALLLRKDEDESALADWVGDKKQAQISAPHASSVSKSPIPASPTPTNNSSNNQDANLLDRIDAEMNTHPQRPIMMRQALCEAMAEEMRMDKDIFIMGEEVAQYQGAYKVTQGLLEEFGAGRVIDTPITEHGLAGLAVGAAFAGLKPIIEFMTFNFSMQAMDHIINSAAKTHYMSGGKISCPIVFRGPNGSARQVAAQHAQDFASWYAHIPGLLVVAPAFPYDAKGLLKSAITNPNPILFLEHELLYGYKGHVPESKDFYLPLDKAHCLKKGRDITLVGYSRSVHIALEASAELEKDNISCEIINLRSLRPLDDETMINSIKKTHRLLVIEECWPHCGIGAEVAATLQDKAFDDLDAPIARISASDSPMPYASNLEKRALPNARQVMDAVYALCR